MKRTVLIIFLSATIITGSAITKVSLLIPPIDAETSSLAWETKEIDAGSIRQNTPLELVFRFTNIGDTPIIITQVRASCGCTAAKHSETPVMPGESSEIKVTYDTRRPGYFNKSITVHSSDSDQPTILRIRGTVE